LRCLETCKFCSNKELKTGSDRDWVGVGYWRNGEEKEGFGWFSGGFGGGRRAAILLMYNGQVSAKPFTAYRYKEKPLTAVRG